MQKHPHPFYSAGHKHQYFPSSIEPFHVQAILITTACMNTSPQIDAFPTGNVLPFNRTCLCELKLPPHSKFHWFIFCVFMADVGQVQWMSKINFQFQS